MEMNAEAAAAAATDTQEEVREEFAQDVKLESSRGATGLAGTPQRQANLELVAATSAVIGAGATGAAIGASAICRGGAACVTGMPAVSRAAAAVPIPGLPGGETSMGPHAELPGRPIPCRSAASAASSTRRALCLQ